MIIALVLKPFWLFISFLIGLTSTVSITDIPNWYASFKAIANIGLCVFPLDVWVACITCFTFWMGVHLTGAVIEWLYRKIPGIS